MGIKEDAYSLRLLKSCMCEAMCDAKGCENCALSKLTLKNWGEVRFRDLMEVKKNGN